jgi:hypothetical protein
VSKKLREFEVEVDGTKLKLAVKRPNYKDQQAAQLVHNKAFREAVEKGSFTKLKVPAILEEQHAWGPEKTKRVRELAEALLAGEKRLKKGGKLSDARKVAIQMARDRGELAALNFERNTLDACTADAHAERARFNYLLSVCVVDPDKGSTYYASPEDLVERDDDPVGLKAADVLGRLLYGLEDDYEAQLPENKFLREQKLVDDQYRLVNRKGDFVDEDGKPLPEPEKEEGPLPFEDDLEGSAEEHALAGP